MENSAIRCASKHGVRKGFQNVEVDLWKWVLNEKERAGKLPTRRNIQDYAVKLYEEAGHGSFKASIGWYRRWKKRYDLKGNRNEPTGKKHNSCRISEIDLNSTKSEKNSSMNSTTVCSPVHNNDGLCSNETFENFSLETDKLINNIDMINSPFEFFNFSDSFDKSMDSVDVHDTLRSSESNNTCMNNFMKELMDDFGKYFSDSTKSRNNATNKLNKKSYKYDKDFKIKIIRFFGEHRIAEAASKFNIHPNTISIWLKDYQFQKQLTEIFIENSAKNLNRNDVVIKEKEFVKWLLDSEKSNVIVTKCEVEEKIADLHTSTWSEQSHWFAKYCCRYLKGKQFKTVKINYPDQFQKVIVNYANKTSQLKAASVFNLARKQLFNWMNNVHTKGVVRKKQSEDKLLQWYDSCTLKPAGSVIRNTAKELYGGDSNCSYGWYYKWCSKHGIIVKRNCDEEIVKWILTSYDQNLNVSHQDIQKRALEIYRERNEGNFKASSGWLLRFCRRYMNLLRRIPPLHISLPPSCETDVTHFRKNILHLRSKYKIKEDSFGVMDEIPLKLKPSGIMNKLNQKKPLLRSCGLENAQGTIILTCLSNGVILPPIITLKDKNCTNTSTRYHVLYKSTEVVDDNVILFWLDNIWFRYVNQPNLLLLDCFSPHTSERVKQKFIDTSSHLEIIPGGCSSKLNPLSQVISPQIQDAIDENCKKWFDENSYSWQIEGSGSSLSSEDILDWITKAYENINTKSTESTVRNVFEGMELLPTRMFSSKQ